MSAFTLALTDVGRARINVHFDSIVHVFLFLVLLPPLFLHARSFISLASRARECVRAYSGASESRVWREARARVQI